MLSRAPLKPSAPSVSLLRFLRSQSDSVLFFTSSPSTHPHSSRNRQLSHTSSLSSWTHINTASCRATLQAGFFKVPNLRSRCLNTPQSRPSVCRSPIAKPFLTCLESSRHSSTKSRPLLRRLLDFRRNGTAGKADKKATTNSGPFLDDGTGNLFNIGRSLAAKASNELRLRCTEFDSNGNVTLINGEFKKSELIAKVGSIDTIASLSHQCR